MVVIDSNDAVCLPCDRDQRTEFLKLGHDIVFGGDCVAVPDESLADWFPIPPEKPSTAMRRALPLAWDACLMLLSILQLIVGFTHQLGLRPVIADIKSSLFADPGSDPYDAYSNQ